LKKKREDQAKDKDPKKMNGLNHKNYSFAHTP